VPTTSRAQGTPEFARLQVVEDDARDPTLEGERHGFSLARPERTPRDGQRDGPLQHVDVDHEGSSGRVALISCATARGIAISPKRPARMERCPIFWR
jgi:hypothetical protein